MSKNLYQAALHQIKGKALESLAVIEVLLDNPAAVSEHTDYVGEIIKHAELLAQYEGAMLTLNQYFGPPTASPQQSPPPPPPSAPPPEPSPESSKALVVTEERSPTMRRAAKKRKMMEGNTKRARAKKKNEEE